jgi:TPR repeat protein
VPQNTAVAANWYRSAADQGHAQAQNNLGVLYGSGRGVPQDMSQAYFWFTLAANRSHPDAANNRDFADRRLTPEQREQTQKTVAAWRPKVTEAR